MDDIKGKGEDATVIILAILGGLGLAYLISKLLSKKEVVEIYNCPKCGREIRKWEATCPSCGVGLDWRW